MKKIILATALLICTATLFSCTGKNQTVTVPGKLNNGVLDNLAEDKLERKITDYALGEDGSFALELTDAQRRIMQSEIKEDLLEEIEDAEYGDESIPSVISIEPATDFSSYKIYVDADKYSPACYEMLREIIYDSALYKIFDGTPADVVDIKVSFIDNKSRAQIDSISYRELN